MSSLYVGFEVFCLFESKAGVFKRGVHFHSWGEVVACSNPRTAASIFEIRRKQQCPKCNICWYLGFLHILLLRYLIRNILKYGIHCTKTKRNVCLYCFFTNTVTLPLRDVNKTGNRIHEAGSRLSRPQLEHPPLQLHHLHW
jgi:hypothetical protein